MKRSKHILSLFSFKVFIPWILYWVTFLIIVYGLFVGVKYVVIQQQRPNKSAAEGFTKNQTVILLGDSILENKSYVKSGYSVEDFVKKSIGNTYNYARDEATIETVHFTLNNIPNKFNNEDTTIILSIGGNDLIEKKEVEPVMRDCTELIEKIKQKFPACKIAMLNLYCPYTYKDNMLIRTMLKQWNTILVEKSGIPIIDIYGIVTAVEDFNSKIEPSETGSAKIADAIIRQVVG